MKRIAILASGLLAVHLASAGVYVETVKHNLTTNTTEPDQKMYVQDGNGRFVDPENHATLIKGSTLYIIDDPGKSYIEMDQATMQQLAQRVSGELDKIKEQMAKLPPEQRQQMEQAMGSSAALLSGKARTVEVKDTGKSDKVNGRACKLWDVTRDGALDQQICVVPYSALPGKENFQQLFANFAKVFEEMAKSVPMLSGMMANEFSAQVKVNGFPVRQRNYDERGKLVDEETVVKEWREEAMPAATFEIPPGYKKKSLPTGPGM